MIPFEIKRLLFSLFIRSVDEMKNSQLLSFRMDPGIINTDGKLIRSISNKKKEKNMCFREFSLAKLTTEKLKLSEDSL